MADESAHAARALTAAGALTARGGNAGDGRALLERAIDAWYALDNREELASALDTLGWLLIYDAGDDPASLQAFEGSLELRRQLEDPAGETRALVGVCQVLVALGEVTRAGALSLELLERAAGDPRAEHFAYHFLADCALIRGDTAEAEMCYRRSLQAALPLGDVIETSVEVQGVAMAVAGNGDPARALRLAGAVEALWESLGVSFSIAFCGHPGGGPMIRLAILGRDVDTVRELLDAASPDEEGCFLLLREGRGVEGRRLVAIDVMRPPTDAWEARSGGHLRPSARWISAAVSWAVSNRAGLLFVHAHPDPFHPMGLSHLDRGAVASLGTTLGPVLEGPFAAIVVHPDGWAGGVWDDGYLRDIDRVVSVGRTLRQLSPVPEPTGAVDDIRLDARQADALGDVHRRLRDLDVVVVGASGLGSPIGEQLVRMGVRTDTLPSTNSFARPTTKFRTVMLMSSTG